MKVIFALVLLCVPAVAVEKAEVTPVQKVVQLMQGMLAKGQKEKHAEQVQFAAYKQFCEDTSVEKTRSIKEANEKIEMLKADIQKYSSKAAKLTKEIAELDEDITIWNGDIKAATSVRKIEKTDYDALHKDYTESIDALERAIAVLKKQSHDRKQDASFLQVSALSRLSLIPAEAKAAIDAFVQEGNFALADSAPEANAYEFQSGGVIDMLEKLETKFKDERLALEKAELNARANYDVLIERLTNSIKANTGFAGQKTSAKAGRLEDKASATGDLALTEKAKAVDEDALSDTTAECNNKAAEFEQNQVTRAEEIEAMQKATEIISSEDVSGAADTHLPALLQRSKTAHSLAQLRSSAVGGNDAKTKAAAYLKSAAQRLDSRYLSVMAAHVSEDAFGKVKKMIKDLIVKLMEEANSEADHNSYCTSELATNKQTREDKGAEVEELTAESEKFTAQSAQLATAITKLSDSISEIRGQQAEAQKMRSEEKATNEATIEDAKTAQVAVEKATSVLREFYGKMESSFVQTASVEKHSGKEPYKGMGSSSGGIFGMLEVILSDFARLESETSSNEDQAASAHEKFMGESTQELEVKETEKTHKEGAKRRTEEDLRSTKKELELTQEELDGALNYYDKLKTDCVDTGMTYEERKQRRAEEIESLQEALKILNGESI